MKRIHIIAGIIVIVGAIVAVLSVSDDLFSPYVSFADAQKSGAYVQIIGRIDQSIAPKTDDGVLVFSIRDERNDRLVVQHKGPKPVNFEHAEQAVILGKYDQTSKTFIAEKVLVKCPSKYQKKG